MAPLPRIFIYSNRIRRIVLVTPHSSETPTRCKTFPIDLIFPLLLTFLLAMTINCTFYSLPLLRAILLALGILGAWDFSLPYPAFHDRLVILRNYVMLVSAKMLHPTPHHVLIPTTRALGCMISC
jgi:hypothetical protein